MFFMKCVLMDVCGVYYGYLFVWNEIGFGGFVSLCGYVWMDFNCCDLWEVDMCMEEGDCDGC